MHLKRDIHSIQSLVLNHTVHSKRLGLHIMSIPPILFKVGFQIWYEETSWGAKCCVPFFGSA